MKILVLNAGSSSLKYQLFILPKKNVMVSGIVERIGESKGLIKHTLKISGQTISEETSIKNHALALKKVSDLLLKGETAVVKSPNEIEAVGHRVVHGGEKFGAPTLISNGQIIDELKALSHLAPLHNPANIIGIEVAQKVFPMAKQVAVFDTAFHHSLPEHAYRYAVPNEWYDQHGLRAYGFHGTSHQYVSEEGANHLGIHLDQFNTITIHLGNGCSMTAIKNGKSIDTSMGLTPMGGLIMGSRPGDFDPSLILFLANNLEMSLEEIDNLLNKQSGLKGLTGDNDLREVLDRYHKHESQARLAIDMYVYRIQKYIGAYAVILGRVDALIFTAGVGENSAFIREKVCSNLNILGVAFDRQRNDEVNQGIREIHSPESKIKLLVVPTNEELQIVNETEKLLA